MLPNGGLAQSPPNVLASAFDSNDGVISFSFLPPVIQAAFTAVSIEDGLSVNYFDPQGTLLFTDSHPGTGNFFTPVDFSYSNPAGIGSVVAVVPDESHADPFAIDDVIFVVPEPATLSVSAFLLLALAGRRPRRSHL